MMRPPTPVQIGAGDPVLRDGAGYGEAAAYWIPRFRGE